MENLIENFIAYLPGSAQFDQRQRQPFAEDWNVSGAEDRQRVELHLLHIVPIKAGSSFVPERYGPAIKIICASDDFVVARFLQILSRA